MNRNLLFDGGDLGSFSFLDVVKWYWPVQVNSVRIPVLMTLLDYHGHVYPVYLKRNAHGSHDQLLVDELKPLFGLNKIGTHSIRLHGIPKKIVDEEHWVLRNGQLNSYIALQWSDYLVFRAETEPKRVIDPTARSPEKPVFICYENLTNMRWIPEPDNVTDESRKFFYELQKIFLFREIFRVSQTELNDVLIRYNPYRSKDYSPLSVDEIHIRDIDQNFKWLNVTTERFFFPKSTSKGDVLVKMFGITQENYREVIRQLKDSLVHVISRVKPSYIWLADYVLQKMTNLCELYFQMMSDLERSPLES